MLKGTGHGVAGALCGASAASIWGGMYVVSKVVLDVIPPFTLLLIRLLIGALILGLWALASEGIHLSRRDLLAQLRPLGLG